ncbi:hypothetical protein Scep_027961 [Stephania cephalantha]|uniref:Uncharacterized protein n=1 Tax=Stephania cephalantha TaxID=152367 RepID=A0AAP0E903_9MAGN
METTLAEEEKTISTRSRRASETTISARNEEMKEYRSLSLSLRRTRLRPSNYLAQFPVFSSDSVSSELKRFMVIDRSDVFTIGGHRRLQEIDNKEYKNLFKADLFCHPLVCKKVLDLKSCLLHPRPECDADYLHSILESIACIEATEKAVEGKTEWGLALTEEQEKHVI